MRETMLIIKREFRERVASKSFVAGTLLFPLLMIALMVLPRLVGGGGSQWDLALVSEAPAGVTDAFEQLLTAPPDADDDANQYRLVRVEGPIATVRERLADRLESQELDGYIALPADVLQSGSIVFRAHKGVSFDVVRELRTAGTRAVQTERLRESGIKVEQGCETNPLRSSSFC